MSDATNYLENKMLDHLVGNATYTPGTLYLALATAVSDAEAGTFTEVTDTGTAYARQSLAAANWDAAGTTTDGTVEINTNIQFATATANYGTVTHAVIVGGTGADTQGGGNPLVIKSLTSSKTIETGDTAVFNSSNLSISLA